MKSCSQKPISPLLSICKYGHHRIIQNIIFKMIPRSIHINDCFWSYVQKYQKLSIIFFIFQQLQSQISQFDKNWLISFCKKKLFTCRMKKKEIKFRSKNWMILNIIVHNIYKCAFPETKRIIFNKLYSIQFISSIIIYSHAALGCQNVCSTVVHTMYTTKINNILYVFT